MSRDLDYLRERHKELLKEKAEKEERKALLNSIKEMEEEGTLKSKIKTGLKKIRSKLQEKGRKLKDNGERLSKRSNQSDQDDTSWKPAIVSMAQESEFKAKKETSQDWEPTITKMLKK